MKSQYPELNKEKVVDNIIPGKKKRKKSEGRTAARKERIIRTQQIPLNLFKRDLTIILENRPRK